MRPVNAAGEFEAVWCKGWGFGREILLSGEREFAVGERLHVTVDYADGKSASVWWAHVTEAQKVNQAGETVSYALPLKRIMDRFLISDCPAEYDFPFAARWTRGSKFGVKIVNPPDWISVGDDLTAIVRAKSGHESTRPIHVVRDVTLDGGERILLAQNLQPQSST